MLTCHTYVFLHPFLLLGTNVGTERYQHERELLLVKPCATPEELKECYMVAVEAAKQQAPGPLLQLKVAELSQALASTKPLSHRYLGNSMTSQRALVCGTPTHQCPRAKVGSQATGRTFMLTCAQSILMTSSSFDRPS